MVGVMSSFNVELPHSNYYLELKISVQKHSNTADFVIEYSSLPRKVGVI